MLFPVGSLRPHAFQSCRVCSSRAAEGSSSEPLDDDRLRWLIAEMDDDNKNVQWSRDEDMALYRLHESGRSVADIAGQLRRGLGGVEKRIRKITDINSKNYVFRNEEWSDGAGGGEGGFSDVVRVYERVLWDGGIDKSDFSFEYEDRFAGPQAAPFVAPNESVKGRERLLIKALPSHRVTRILYKDRVVWDKAARLDLVFASSSNGMTKLDDVIAGHDDWLAAEAARRSHKRNPTLFCDLDGVLCDFDLGVQRLFRGKRPAEVSPRLMWSVLSSPDKNFYGTLPWLEDGRLLWSRLGRCFPVLLSGVPGRTDNASNWAALQKRQWVDRHLGEEFRLITCSSKKKHLYCEEGDVLVDDNGDARAAWEAAGGTFVLFDVRRDGNVEAVLEAIAAADGSFDFTSASDGDDE